LLPNTEKFEPSTCDLGWVAVLSLKLTGRLPDVKEHTFMMLKEVHDFKEIVGARIAGWSEHAHEAFRRNMRGLGQAVEANGGIDVVA
jgi:hypothetical protein